MSKTTRNDIYNNLQCIWEEEVHETNIPNGERIVNYQNHTIQFNRQELPNSCSNSALWSAINSIWWTNYTEEEIIDLYYKQYPLSGWVAKHVFDGQNPDVVHMDVWPS